MNLTFIVGQTGVGKSTTLNALEASGLDFVLLPNRRSLADSIIIPEMQKVLGESIEAVQDRVERFRLTAAYRNNYEGGMVHALTEYLSQEKISTGKFVFDNIRGLEECKAALERFKNARFIFLFAPPFVRLQRVLGRHDAFDTVAATRLENTAFAENLERIEGAKDAFDLYELARFEANSGHSDEAILNAVKIISTEFKNYNAEDAARFLQKHLSNEYLLYLDSSELSIDEVSQSIKAWI